MLDSSPHGYTIELIAIYVPKVLQIPLLLPCRCQYTWLPCHISVCGAAVRAVKLPHEWSRLRPTGDPVQSHHLKGSLCCDPVPGHESRQDSALQMLH